MDEQQEGLVPNGTILDALEGGTGAVGRMVEGLALVFSMTLTPPQLVMGHTRLKEASEALESLVKMIRNKLVTLIETDGTEKAETKGARELRVGNQMLQINPHKTGVDPKKLEAHLRARDIDLSLAMDSTVSWSVNEEKLKAAVKAGTITADELGACMYERSWNLQRPRSVS